jgi:PLP dependent protein
VGRLKLATVLEKECIASGRDSLNVLIQVNTSMEDSKSGCSAEECVNLVQKVIETCPHLKFRGFMTIGNPDPEKCTDDFELLFKLREDVSKTIGVEPSTLDLSMGMSGDFEKAVAHGSTIVRVGSIVFGARCYPMKKE